MRRVADFLFRNWPLKLAAILLATVLYSGLVVGQNVRTWSGTLPVSPLRPPAGATLLADPDPVTQVRYRAPLDVGVVSANSFTATVDLSSVDVQPGGEPQSVPVTVDAKDPRVIVVDFQPREVQISLDPVTTRDLPINVSMTSVPDGLKVGPPQTEPSTATIRGASSRIDAVTSVVARVALDASALNVDRTVDLIAIDSNSNQVSNVEIEPARARVRIAVARELANRSLPVVPIVTGQPAAGFRVTSVTVEPTIVTVSGEEATVSQLETAETEAIDISGRSRDLEAMVRVALPSGVSVAGSDTVRVVVTIGEDTGTRTLQLGVELSGEASGVSYQLSQSVVNVIIGGAVTELDAVDASQMTARADVGSLPDSLGPHVVPLVVTPPGSLDVVAIDPSTVVVTVGNVAPSLTSALP